MFRGMLRLMTETNPPPREKSAESMTFCRKLPSIHDFDGLRI
jgi:hypothetical protein